MKNLAGILRAVAHQLTHGEASEGDVIDIAGCARQVAEVATALGAEGEESPLRDALESAHPPAEGLSKKHDS